MSYSKNKNINKINISTISIHTVFIIFSLLCMIPLIAILSMSLSNDRITLLEGYSLIPKGFNIKAYIYLLNDPTQILNAYKVSITVCVVGTATSLLLTSGIAYVLSRRDYSYRRQLSFYSFFPMMFSAGLVPSYILISNYLHMKNTIFVLFVPALISPMYVLILRTFMSKIPFEIIESCMVDGASEYTIFFRIVFPLAKSGLATIALFTLLGYWNDWFSSMLYIEKESLVSLQYLLVRILSTIEFLTNSTNQMPAGMKTSELPRESARMAMAILAAGPMLFVFPFFQKYFVKGLTIGSVKG